MWVDSNLTGHAQLASSASFQRGAHTHQKSPGCSPGNPNCGLGVDKSLPVTLLNSRNSRVTCAQTVWEPMSSGLVLQSPFRKNPVTGSIEHSSIGLPSTFNCIGLLPLGPEPFSFYISRIIRNRESSYSQSRSSSKY